MTKRWLLGCIAVIGCGKSSGTEPAGGGSAGGAAAAGRASSGDCAPVRVCDVIPPARVDAACGTKTAKANPQDNDQMFVGNECHYMAANNSSNVDIARICFTAGADQAKQLFKMDRDQQREGETITDLPGLGDEAYFRAQNHRFGEVNVRKGNVQIKVQGFVLTPETEEAMKTQCLIALYRDLAAK